MKGNFAKLQDRAITKVDIISKASLLEGFESVFGIESPYIAGRLYNILAGPDFVDITMPLFLHKFRRLINGEFPERLNFGFILYNASGDGNLKSVEISDMMDAVPQSGPMYNE